MKNATVGPHSQALRAEFTVARALKGRVLAKSFARDQSGGWAKLSDYDNVRTFEFARRSVGTLAELAETLRDLSTDRSTCVLHGRAVVEGGPQFRRSKARIVPNGATEPPTIVDAPTAFLAVDIDKLPAVDPEALRQMTPEQLAGFAVACSGLPERFWGAPCVVQLTSSHGIQPGAARVRLYYLLERALTHHERKALVEGAQVDEKVFRCEQAIYTAAPIFEGGADPYSDRFFLVDTPFDEHVRVPSVLSCAEGGRRAPTATNGGQQRSGSVEGSGWRRFLDQAGEHFFVEIQSAIGSFVAIEGPSADPGPLFAAIDALLDEKALPTRGEDYVAVRKADAREWHRRAAAQDTARRDPRRVDWADLDAPQPAFGSLADAEKFLEGVI